MTLREQLGEAEPRFPLKGAWNKAIRSLRAWGRRSRRKPRLGGRAELDRLLKLPASREDAARIKAALKALMDTPESDQAAATLDALASELLPRLVRGLVPVHVANLPARLGEMDYLRLTGLPSRHAVIDAMGVAVLRHRLHGEVLGGKKLDVQAMLPDGAHLPAVPRSQRAKPTPRNRQAAWLDHLDDEGRWSLTPLHVARRQAQAAMGSVVIDVGCGCGGNAVAFAEAGFQVFAIEPDPGRRALAAQNLRARGLEDAVELSAGTAAERLSALIERDSCAAIFIDPPWGGPDWTRRAISWDELIAPLGVSTEVLRSGTQLLVKAPRTFDVSTLPGAEAWRVSYEFGVHDDDRRIVKCITASSWSPPAQSFDTIQ